MYIYGLYEKGKDEIKYVGKTDNLKRRLEEHIRHSKNNKTTKEKWIKSILDSNNEIDIKSLEECINWENREKYWISILENLTNETKGGECGKNCVYTISYDDCKKLIKEFNINSKSEWFEYVKNNNIHDEIPKNPAEHYKKIKKWVSWGDFLGTGKVQDNKIIDTYLNYDEAKIEIHKLNIKSSIDWKNNVKNGNIPKNIPNRPERYYKKRGWISWGDFLGTGYEHSKKFLSYEECSKFAINNNIKSNIEWRKFKKPNNIPSTPDNYYKEWISWGVFLGTNRICDNDITKNYLNYEDAKFYIKNNMNIKNGRDWKDNFKLNKIPIFIPNHPENYYNNKDRGWNGWKDFLNK